MTSTELHTVRATESASLPSRVGETIAEVAFALLLVGIWLVTCMAG